MNSLTNILTCLRYNEIYVFKGMDQREVVCPTKIDEVLSAKERLGCGNDIYGNSQYICLPNKEKTQLEEVCRDGIMGMIEKGTL